MGKSPYDRKDKCCGCGVCANVCPVNALSMQEDSFGFLYPAIEESKCIHCGKCKSHCPTIMHDKLLIDTHHCENYAGYLLDEKKILECASGGASTALSEAVLENDGVVYGVCYDNRYRCAKTCKVSAMEGLLPLRDSKYMQSDKGTIYPDVKKELDTGRWVLYTGTPCEIGAVKAYLEKDYENLFTCELICHGPTSYKVAERFLSEKEKKAKSKVTKMSVKNKDRGWKIPYLKLTYENGTSELDTLYHTDFGKAFDVLRRDSCHACVFKGDGSVADVTVGDFWGAKEEDPFWNSNGISAICVHTERGKQLIHMLNSMRLFPVEYGRILSGNRNLETSEPERKGRRLVGEGMNSFGLSRTMCVYSLYKKTKERIRKILR